MGQTRHVHQYIGASLLHRLHATRGGCGFLQHRGDTVQDAAIIYLVIERRYCAVIDNDVYIGSYLGGVESTERCHSRNSVPEHK